MYKRETRLELIDTSRLWNAQGCNSYMVLNHGNVNVTVNGVFVLRPGQWFNSPDEKPEIIDNSDLDFQFDELNDPAYIAPTTGPRPTQAGGAPNIGDPVPQRDMRVVILKSFLSKLEK